MAKEIPLSQNQFAIVDDEDYGWLNQWKWTAHLLNGSTGYYACRSVEKPGHERTPCGNKKRDTIFMHRLIVGTEEGKVTDHIDGNGLNNQRSNLRACTFHENSANSKKFSTNTSGHKNIGKTAHGWRVRFSARGKRIQVGYFDTLAGAKEALRVAALKHLGEFANLG